MIKRIIVFALALCAAILVTGCGKDKDKEQSEQSAGDAPAIQLSPDTPAIQLSPDAPAIQAVNPVEPAASLTPAPDGIPDPGDEQKPDKLSYSADYAAYAVKNSDVIGWISVPNTHIEYPVLQTDDNDFYLTHTPEKKYSKSGSIFMDSRCDPQSSRHVIVYGHNMRNGTMFHDLRNFKNKDFFANTPTITLYDKNGEKQLYDIYAAYIVTSDMDFARTKFADDAAFLAYFEGLRANSKFQPKNDITLAADSQILTLITCTYEYDDSRYLVQAVKR